MKISNISRELGLPMSERLCTPAAAQAMWQQSAHKPVALLGRDFGTALHLAEQANASLRSERPVLLPTVDDVPNYTTALSAHQVRRLLPTP